MPATNIHFVGQLPQNFMFTQGVVRLHGSRSSKPTINLPAGLLGGSHHTRQCTTVRMPADSAKLRLETYKAGEIQADTCANGTICSPGCMYAGKPGQSLTGNGRNSIWHAQHAVTRVTTLSYLASTLEVSIRISSAISWIQSIPTATSRLMVPRCRISIRLHYSYWQRWPYTCAITATDCAGYHRQAA